MTEKKATRREYLELTAVNPADGGMTTVHLSFARLQAVGKRSMGHAKECGYIVPQVLQKPSAIFEGLTQDEDEDSRGTGWRCYCGIPSQSYDSDGIPGRPYRGQVYLVFINDDGVAYNWRWEKADQDDPKMPNGYKTRFRKHLL